MVDVQVTITDPADPIEVEVVSGIPGPPGADGSSIPDGGTTGQVLTKQSNTDGDADWEDPTGGGGAVDSVNGQTGVVVLDYADVGADAAGTAAAAVSAHEADTTNVHGIADTSALVLTGDSRLTDSRTPSGSAGGVLSGTYPNPGFAADMATQAELDGHVNDTTAAHAASAISFSPAGTIAATDAQAAIAEVATDAAGALSSHEADTTSIHGIADTSALETTSGAQAKADAKVSDTAYDATSWDGVTTVAPSKNAVRDKINSLAKGDVGLGNVDNTSDATKNAATATLTNKRVTPRVLTHSSNATPTINTDNYDQVNLSLSTAVTSMTTNLSGTPTDGQRLMFRITGDATPRAITWGASFQSSGIATLLATTVASKTHHVGFVWDAAISKWVCLAVDATGY